MEQKGDDKLSSLITSDDDTLRVHYNWRSTQHTLCGLSDRRFRFLGLEREMKSIFSVDCIYTHFSAKSNHRKNIYLGI